jgi:tRNA threonylcarbamoyladenosine biosynthesis protein TsaB
MLSAESSNLEPLILAIETATRAGGVAVARGETLLSRREGDASISHSTNLIEMIDAVLNEAGAQLSDVEVFAVGVGPGSFTGLRIGLATVKAFAEVNQRPIVGISTLAAVAHASALEGQVVSLLPAGRGEVFAQMFSVAAGDVAAKDEPAHLSPADTIARYGSTPGVKFSGDGAPKLSEYIRHSAQQGVSAESRARIINSLDAARNATPLAGSIAALALKDYREGKAVKPEDLQAVYVRPSDAEINERWQQQKQQQPAQG